MTSSCAAPPPPPPPRVILPQLKILGKCPVKLGQFFMTLEEDLLNYSMYFKNLPQQTQLMQEGGIGFFGVSAHGGRDWVLWGECSWREGLGSLG